MTQKLILTFAFTAIALAGFSQSFDEKIEKLIEIEYDYTIEERWTALISNMVDNNIENYYPNVKKRDAKKLKKQLIANELEKIRADEITLFKKYYTEEEVDALLEFTMSPVGQKMRKVKRKFSIDNMNFTDSSMRRLNENLAYIINDKYELGNNFSKSVVMSTDYIEYTGKENHNVTVDFGDVTGKGVITQIIQVKNTSDEEMQIGNFFMNQDKDDVLVVTWDKQPIQPNEIGEIKFTLNANCVSGTATSSSSINLYPNEMISYKVIYRAEGRKMEVAVENDELTFEKFDGTFSKTYTFKVQNNGSSDIRIKDLRFSSKAIFVNYNKEFISSGETAEINVIYSQALILKYGENEIDTTIEVEFQQCYNDFNVETVELKIK